MRLTALLRSVLRSEGEFTTLGRELDLIGAYLDIEHAASSGACACGSTCRRR
jgi:LytS/YehU family sensor histidine kinase